jgi:enoyl-CoA hydratase/carnithine racemase
MTMSATNGLFQGVQYENVIVDHGGSVATVTFDRKGSLNALGAPLNTTACVVRSSWKRRATSVSSRIVA